MTQTRQPSGTPAAAALISDEYRQEIAAVQADPIAIAMAAEIPNGVEVSFIAALREYERRGGTHGTTHMGAVSAALANLRI